MHSRHSGRRIAVHLLRAMAAGQRAHEAAADAADQSGASTHAPSQSSPPPHKAVQAAS